MIGPAKGDAKQGQVQAGQKSKALRDAQIELQLRRRRRQADIGSKIELQARDFFKASQARERSSEACLLGLAGSLFAWPQIRHSPSRCQLRMAEIAEELDIVCRPKSLALRRMSISGSNKSVKPCGKANEIGRSRPLRPLCC